MMTASTRSSVAVCSWSLEPTSIDDLIDKVRACGLSRVQLALEPLLNSPAKWKDASRALRDAGIEIVSGMMGCVGEDYSTIARIKATGGVMPDETYPATLENMRRAVPLAAELNMKLVTFHAGFIPHDAGGKEFEKGLARVTEIAQVFAGAGLAVALETGQEPADALLEFLAALQPIRIGVNFDPANMLLYGSGDPIAALQQLLPHVRQVHIKDAIASRTAGEWGREVPAGTGGVDWQRFFQLLPDEQSVSRVVEREAGTSRVADVITARELVQTWSRA